MDIINYHYNRLCRETGDINEHLPTLAAYAAECESVADLGSLHIKNFLANNADCVLHKHYTINNGLTILRRI